MSLAAQKSRATKKLSNEQVRGIRKRAAAGEPQKDLAAEYGVSKGTLSLVVNQKTYIHVV